MSKQSDFVKNTIQTGMEAASTFKKEMQNMVDRPETGFSSVSMSTDGGKTYLPIATKNKQPMKDRIETLNIKHTLSDEMLELSKELSEHLNKKKQAEDSLAYFSAQKKTEIKGHDATINRSATIINSGSEYRDEKCKVLVNTDRNEVTWISLSTGDIVQVENPIPARYMQLELENF